MTSRRQIRLFRRTALALVALCLAGTSAPAGPTPEAALSPDDRFAESDLDGDGRLSRQEFAAALPLLRQDAFAVMDADGDGFISREEWRRVRMEHSMPPSRAADGMRRGPDLRMPSPHGGGTGREQTLPQENRTP